MFGSSCFTRRKLVLLSPSAQLVNYHEEIRKLVVKKEKTFVKQKGQPG